MQVTHVINAFFPCKIWGGPPQNTLILGKGLQSQGHHVSVLTSNILDAENRISEHTSSGQWDGLPVTYLKTYWVGHNERSTGAIISTDLKSIRQAIRSTDIVHIHGYRHYMFVVASFMALWNKKPVVLHARGSISSVFGRSKLKRFFDKSLGRFIMRRISGAVALSAFEAAEYRTLGVPSERIIYIPNAFDAATQPPLPNGNNFREKYDIGSDEIIVLFLARLHERKGLGLLIDAFAQLNTDDRVRLCIVGPDHGYEATARTKVANLQLTNRVCFVGALFGAEKWEAYRAADLFVIPSAGGEGLPTTVMEACHAQLPIIITKTIEVSQLIDRQVGRAVDYDVAQLRDALERLIDDVELRKTYRQNCQAFLEQHFSVERVVNEHIELYERVYTNSQ